MSATEILGARVQADAGGLHRGLPHLHLLHLVGPPLAKGEGALMLSVTLTMIFLVLIGCTGFLAAYAWIALMEWLAG